MSQICIPVKTSDSQQAQKEILAAQKSADVVEIWLDQIADLQLKELVKIKKKPFLAVVKTPDEQGKFKQSDSKKIDLLIKCADLKFEYIDTAMDTDPKEIKRLIKNKKNSQIILSYHNFSQTPLRTELRKIIRKHQTLEGDIIKIAVQPQTEKDVITVIELALELKEKQIPAIIISMGEKGKITRIVAPELDSVFMYAPLTKDQSSAPGQITADNLRQLWGC